MTITIGILATVISIIGFLILLIWLEKDNKKKLEEDAKREWFAGTSEGLDKIEERIKLNEEKKC